MNRKGFDVGQHHPIDRARLWVRANWKPITTLLSIALLAGSVYGALSYRHHSVEAKAQAAWFAADKGAAENKMSAFEKVAADYPNTVHGRMAMLTVAKDHFNKGEFAKVTETLAPLKGKWFKPVELAYIATNLVAQANEAEGNVEGAQKLYETLAKNQENPFRFEAMMGTARMLESQKKWDDAKGWYQKVIDAAASSDSLRQAAKDQLIGVSRLQAQNG